MSKGLEALERIIETFYDKESEDIKIIEKELKVLEIIKKVLNISYKKAEIENWEIMRYITQEELELLREWLQR